MRSFRAFSGPLPAACRSCVPPHYFFPLFSSPSLFLSSFPVFFFVFFEKIAPAAFSVAAAIAARLLASFERRRSRKTRHTRRGASAVVGCRLFALKGTACAKLRLRDEAVPAGPRRRGRSPMFSQARTTTREGCNSASARADGWAGAARRSLSIHEAGYTPWLGRASECAR